MAYGLKDLAQFKLDTAHKHLKHVRGSNIEPIDDLLETWETPQVQHSVADRIAVLSQLITTCKSWLRLKRTKKGIPGEDEASSYARRYFAIKALGNQALQKLFELDQGLALANQRYSDRKGFRTPDQFLKHLGSSYGNELESYRRSNKTFATSGSHVHDLFSNAQEWAPTQKKAFKSLSEQESTRNKMIAIVTNKTLDSLTLEQFNKLAELGKKVNTGLVGVKYYSRLERLKLMVQFTGEGLLGDYQGQLLTGDFIYAIDRYGNLYVKLLRRGEDTVNGQRLNHSSLAAGNEVLCAGILEIQNGLLKMISNNSGHYKPSRDNLENAVTLLSDIYYVDLSKCMVVTYLPDLNRPGWLELRQYTTALDFTKNLPLGPPQYLPPV